MDTEHTAQHHTAAAHPANIDQTHRDQHHITHNKRLQHELHIDDADLSRRSPKRTKNGTEGTLDYYHCDYGDSAAIAGDVKTNFVNPAKRDYADGDLNFNDNMTK